MKSLILLLSATTLLADPLCLQQATSRELLDEVGRRMGSSNPTQESTASYSCDLYGTLTIHLLGNTGVQTATVDAGTANGCEPQAAELSQFRSHIRAPSFLAVCDPYGTLHKFAATPQGVLTKVSEVNSTPVQCRKSATAINMARA